MHSSIHASPAPCFAQRLAGLLALATAATLAACTATSQPRNGPQPPNLAALPSSPPVPAEAPPSPPVVSPADAALAQGLKAYQSAQYTIAETQFNTALQGGLKAPADVANAHKHLAFIYCTSRRETACAKAFKAARAADPDFALTKTEAGHPMWGPLYRKALPGAKPSPAKNAAAKKTATGKKKAGDPKAAAPKASDPDAMVKPTQP